MGVSLRNSSRLAMLADSGFAEFVDCSLFVDSLLPNNCSSMGLSFVLLEVSKDLVARVPDDSLKKSVSL